MTESAAYVHPDMFWRGEHVLLGDGAINVRYNHPIVPVPQVDSSLTATGTLVLCGHTEHHFIGTFTQI